MPTPAEYAVVQSSEKGRNNMSANGRFMARQMLGSSGATVAGRGGWVSVKDFGWKTFVLRSQNQAVALPADCSVAIEVCNELDPNEPVTLTQAVEIFELNNTDRTFTFEPPFAYVRARVKSLVATPIQVDINAFGL